MTVWINWEHKWIYSLETLENAWDNPAFIDYKGECDPKEEDDIMDTWLYENFEQVEV